MTIKNIILILLLIFNRQWGDSVPWFMCFICSACYFWFDLTFGLSKLPVELCTHRRMLRVWSPATKHGGQQTLHVKVMSFNRCQFVFKKRLWSGQLLKDVKTGDYFHFLGLREQQAFYSCDPKIFFSGVTITKRFSHIYFLIHVIGLFSWLYARKRNESYFDDKAQTDRQSRSTDTREQHNKPY